MGNPQAVPKLFVLEDYIREDEGPQINDDLQQTLDQAIREVLADKAKNVYTKFECDKLHIRVLDRQQVLLEEVYEYAQMQRDMHAAELEGLHYIPPKPVLSKDQERTEDFIQEDPWCYAACVDRHFIPPE